MRILEGVPEGVPALAYEGLPQPRHDSDLQKLQEYEYRPFEDNQSIRLFILAPGEQNDPLKGRLEVVNVDSAGSYEPISYSCGEPGPPNCRYEIILCDGDDERLLKLESGNLFAALRRFRHPHSERRVWVDQICISQADLEEKGQQILFMNKIYKNASHVLVWLGLDRENEAEPAFKLVHLVNQRLQDEAERENFYLQFTRDLDQQSREEWAALHSLTNRSWFKRGWIVQEVGTRASSTIFWGDAEIDWGVLYNVCEELTHYHHLRTEFDIRTSEIKFLFQRFVEPDASSYHANRFNFIYELHRARGLKFTDQHDRIFAFLGHYALGMVDSPDPKSVAIQPDYTKTVEQVYIDVAKWALKSIQGSSALIALAAVQHLSLPSRHTLENQQDIGTPAPDKNRLPSWVPDWRTYQGFILSEPINPHRAHGSSKPKLEIGEDDPILQIQGLEIDTIEACSRVLDKEFHKKADKPGFELTVEYLWREICQKGRFNLSDEYLDGQKAFFAFMQTLSNGCVQIAGRESKSFDEISESRWLEQAALYLKKFICRPDMIAPELLEMAEQADRNQVKEEWSRSANGASKNRIFARTRKGYYILGPAVMEVGDVVCVLFGGKMPFCLRPMGRRYMLGGECYAHGLMKGEAIDMMDRNEPVEKVFELV